jgi:hypothetical protein
MNRIRAWVENYWLTIVMLLFIFSVMLVGCLLVFSWS